VEFFSIFSGPYEHHSLLLPWRELGSEVVNLPDDFQGGVDVQRLELEMELRKDSGRRLVGCFSAASNITGILTDTDAITSLLHRYGAVAIWYKQ